MFTSGSLPSHTTLIHVFDFIISLCCSIYKQIRLATTKSFDRPQQIKT